MSRPPEFHDLVGDVGTPEELERLRRTHELLIAAGPPAELPPHLAEPPQHGVRAPFRLRPRRRFEAALVLAAALLVAAFAAGYLLGDRGGRFETVRVVAMHSLGAAPAAQASIRIGDADSGGNWPMILTVNGLEPLPKGSWYELYLTKDGKITASCGTFNTTSRRTVVRLSAAYDLKRYDGWVVTAHVRGGADKQGKVLLTTADV